jgi:hypothetical protein
MAEKKPPTSIKLVAVLQILFGALGLVSAVTNLVSLAAGLQPGGFMSASANDPVAQAQKDFYDGLARLPEKLPGGMAVQYGLVGTEALLSGMMLASGIGLLKLRPWARILAIIYALTSLLHKVCLPVYFVLYYIPAMNQFADELGAKGTEHQVFAFAARITAYAQAFGPVLLAIYPLAVLFFMLKPSTRAAFRESQGAVETPVPAPANPPTA